jgi:hypothetical protein
VSRHPVGHPTGYARPDQMWAALTDHIKNLHPDSTAELQRRFLYDRLLARVFTHDPTAWVLKGGTALLARVHDARHSRDVDLNHTSATLEAAVEELRVATATDLSDHVRFIAASTHRINEPRHGLRGRANARLQVTPYIGVRPMHPFGIDVVVNTLITTAPDLHQVTPVVAMIGITSPPYRLYSVVDHVADKVCATMELYAGKPSSRHRDLIDLVIIACTQTIQASALAHAVDAERRYRGLPPIAAWVSPPQWAIPYRRAASATAHCVEYPSFASATALITRFLDPVLSGGLAASTWDPKVRQWVSAHP